MKINNSAQQKNRSELERLYLGAMKSLKHFASFDWSAEIDDGRITACFLVLNVSAPGPAGPEVCRPRSAAAALLLV